VLIVIQCRAGEAGEKRMELDVQTERRAQDSRPLRPGALRCESCGTTWFDPLAQHYATVCKCRRCGGRLHGERRGLAALKTAA
jgi:hypothetical protein